jgi:hypothetical protein
VSTRYIAQRALSRRFLDYSVPLVTDGGQHELSASGSLTGTISPDVGALRTSDGRPLLEEWGTLLHEETDGVITWSGIVISSSWQGKDWTVECAGYPTYLNGTPFQGVITGAGLDPLDVVRRIWAEVQSHADSDLGVTVVGPTLSGVKLGTTEDPYDLVWWNTPDAGREITQLAGDAPFDFITRSRWDGDDIRHEFVVGYPRLGKRRHDLTFLQGVNITANLTPSVGGDDFANAVVGLGAGEGKGAVRRATAVSDGRLRRTRVLSQKAVTQTSRLDAMIRDELQRRQAAMTIESIQVVDHPNALIGSWDIGDDILVTGTIPWLGEIELWHRIVGWAPAGPHRGVLKLAPSDSFTYGSST